MLDSIIKTFIGDLEEKREYKQLMKRVDALPDEYRYTFKKIRRYMYSVGAPNGNMSIFTDMTIFVNLVELFEASAADGMSVLDVIGADVSSFADELMSVSAGSAGTPQEKLNKEIKEKLGQGDN